MSLFVALFLGMFLYGILAGKLGAGLIALAVAGFVYWANKQLCKQNNAYYNSPDNARKPPATAELLDRQHCQCIADKL